MYRQMMGTSVAALLLVSIGSGPAHAAGQRAAGPPQPGEAISRWADRTAQPLPHTEFAAPLDDLVPLARAVGPADIVGLGESVHGAAEETVLKARTLRLLVERLGFRSIAWEEDWTTGLRIDRYLRTGHGDPRRLVAKMTGQWQSRPVLDLLRWVRRFNAGHSDQVRFVGVEYYYTGRSAYAAVDRYVARVSPDRLARLRSHLRPIRPTANARAYAKRFARVPDKRPYLRHAHAAFDLVRTIPHQTGDRSYQLARHHARQILSFYEHNALPTAAANVFREAHAAANLRWWQTYTGDRVAYWAASPHTANAPDLRLAVPGPDFRFASAGSYLRRWFGDRYLSIGFTFTRGTVGFTPAETVPVPTPDPHWFEAPLGRVAPVQFALDLRGDVPRAVRDWLHAPATTRGLPQAGPDAYTDGGSLGQWFDLLVHSRLVHPLEPAQPAAR